MSGKCPPIIPVPLLNLHSVNPCSNMQSGGHEGHEGHDRHENQPLAAYLPVPCLYMAEISWYLISTLFHRYGDSLSQIANHAVRPSPPPLSPLSLSLCSSLPCLPHQTQPVASHGYSNLMYNPGTCTIAHTSLSTSLVPFTTQPIPDKEHEMNPCPVINQWSDEHCQRINRHPRLLSSGFECYAAPSLLGSLSAQAVSDGLTLGLFCGDFGLISRNWY